MAMQRIKLPISGMTCAACAYRVEQSLATAEGVTEVYVSRTPAYASVRYDPTRINLLSLVKRVYNEGYGIQQATLNLSIVGAIVDGNSILEEALGKQAGVLSATVDATNQKAQITYIPGTLHRADMVKVVEQAGYSVLEESKMLERSAHDDPQYKGLLPSAGAFFLKLFWKFLNRS